MKYKLLTKIQEMPRSKIQLLRSNDSGAINNRLKHCNTGAW